MLKSVCTNLSDKKGVSHLYPGITIFLDSFLKYCYTRKPGLTISRFNDIILTSPWHIVKPGFHCTTTISTTTTITSTTTINTTTATG